MRALAFLTGHMTYTFKNLVDDNHPRLHNHLVLMMLWRTSQNQHQFNAYRIANFKITIINYPLHLILKDEPFSTKKVFVKWHLTFLQGFIKQNTSGLGELHQYMA